MVQMFWGQKVLYSRNVDVAIDATKAASANIKGEATSQPSQAWKGIGSGVMWRVLGATKGFWGGDGIDNLKGFGDIQGTSYASQADKQTWAAQSTKEGVYPLWTKSCI